MTLVLPGLGARDGQSGTRREHRMTRFHQPRYQQKPQAAEAAPRPKADTGSDAAVPSGDIALIQLPDKRGVVAYAYRLSDSRPLPEAELQLLNLQGEVVERFAVKEGIVQGEIAKDDYRLRLVCGEETLEQDISWKGYEAPPHPLAPDTGSKWLRAFVISDRRAYSPGEEVRFSGFVRRLAEGQLHFPQGAGAELYYDLPGPDGRMHRHRQPIELAADGSFVCSFTLPDKLPGVSRVQAVVHVHGGTGYGIGIRIQENPALALQMEGGFSLQGRELHAHARVYAMDGAPPAGRGLLWSLRGEPVNPMPKGADGYLFGDWRPEAPLPREFRRYGDALEQELRGSLDAQGLSEARFTLPEMPFPRRMELRLAADCGHAYGLRHEERLTIDPAGLYVGLRRESCLSPVGGTLSLSLLLAEAGAGRYEGEPVELELTSTFHRFEAGRFGVGNRLAPSGEEVCRRKLTVPAEGATVELPLAEAGAYDIVLRGRDAEGREFASAIRQYAWSEGAAPWVRHCEQELILVADKQRYRVGETARVYIPGEVEGEALVMVRGADSRRFLRCPVRACSRWVDVPLLQEDGPAPMLEIVLVQGKVLRPRHGRPIVQRGSKLLSVENMGASPLSVRLDELPVNLPPGASCELGGCVRDNTGRPLPHVSVLIGVQNMGLASRFTRPSLSELTVQEQGADAHALYRAFIGVREISELPSPMNYFHAAKHYRAGAALEPAEQSADESSVAGEGNLWQRVKTDAEGRFRARISVPERLADYDVVALACGVLPTQFGADGERLTVDTPLSLRAESPVYAHVGDVIHLPLHLRLASLPEGAPERTRWRVSLVGQSGAECLRQEHEVELAAGELVTLDVPVRLTEEGTARLRWQVRAPEGQEGTEQMSAEATCGLHVLKVGPSAEHPQLTRTYERRLENGSWEAATHFKQGDFVRVTLERRGWTHVGEDKQIADFLPTGWQPVLHESAANCSAPWVPVAVRSCAEESGWTGWLLPDGWSPPEYAGPDCLLFRRSLNGRLQRLSYIVRVTTRGEFTAPPARLGAGETTSNPTRVVVGATPAP